MKKEEIRIGTVSSVDIETGMVSVVYQDRDGEVTQLLPYATFNDEYKVPDIGAKVVVAHLSNGSEMGVILGTYWSEDNSAGNPGVYHKRLGGKAYFNYNGETLTIAAEHICFLLPDEAQGPQKLEIGAVISDIGSIKKRLAEIEKKV